MSLILEALRKLEREKPAPERGVVVMTAAGLADSRSHRGPWLWVMLGLAAGLVVAAAYREWRQPPHASTAQAPPAVTALPTSTPPAPVTVVSSVPAVVGSPSTPMPQVRREPRPLPTVPSRSVATPEPAAPAPAATLAAPMPAPALVLQAITVQDGRPVVLINDRVLREGDEIQGVRILHIGEAEVEIERDGQREVLRF